MKITVEHYEQKVSVETKHDDVAFEDFMELIRRVANATGYSPVTVNEWYNE